MPIDYDILPEIILYAIGFFIAYYLCYRKYIYSILDPLFIYVFTISFSSVLIINVLVYQPEYIVHFFGCQIFFFVGFSSTSYWANHNRQPSSVVTLPTQFFDYKTLRTAVYLLFALYAFGNVVIFYTSGFALLSADPTTAKVENFVQGFGIILKINWGVGSFVIAALLFFILSKPRQIDIVLLAIATLFTALEGSKSSLLRILITLVLLLNHPVFRYKKKIVEKIKWFAPLGIIAVLAVFFVVLSKENTDSEQALFAFVRRLLYGADSTLYFYSPINAQYFSQFHFWDYIGHFLNPILGFLRIVPYDEAFGNLMVMNDFPNMIGTIVGPNTPFYIEGQVFFGYYGAFVYSFLVGGSYAFIRQYFFQAKYYSAFWLILICCLCQEAGALFAEVTLFVTQAFDTCFFVVPVYVFVSLVMNGKISIRWLHYE